nr:hydroxymethylpyrimidine/phosphomethylpyrimidine kinase [Flavobacteriales bacterium]
MQQQRPYVLTVAGFDPSGGAGLLADVKTFEQHKVYGLGVSTANTLQTEDKFYSVEWENIENVLKAVDIMLDTYPVKVIKTGIVPSFDYLYAIVSRINHKNPKIKIVVDPVIKSSSGFEFHGPATSGNLQKVLSNVYLITPNLYEATRLTGNTDSKKAAKELSAHCHVLLKGGHAETNTGVDYLFTHENCFALEPENTGVPSKHGSGCVLSASIAANLARDYDLTTSCKRAKTYVEAFLTSNRSLLGFHYV